jgi:hypothetical protein
MPSHNRITVNLPSRSLYSDLKKLAQKKELTLSGLVQKIVIASIRSDATDTVFLDELRADISPESAEKKDRNLIRILHSTVSMPKEEHTSDRRVTLKASSLALRDYQYELPAVEFERNTQVEPLNCKVTNEYKKLARDSLRDHVTSMVPLITSQLGGAPDILHLFVKKALIQYYCDDDGQLHFNIRPELHVLPLLIDDAMNSRLDFLQIRFKQFKDVAVNGWDKSQYERLILIDNASTTRSGGYFVGLSLYKLDYMADEYKDFHRISIDNDTGRKSVNCMVHIHHRAVKFKRILKPLAP